MRVNPESKVWRQKLNEGQPETIEVKVVIFR